MYHFSVSTVLDCDWAPFGAKMFPCTWMAKLGCASDSIWDRHPGWTIMRNIVLQQKRLWYQLFKRKIYFDMKLKKNCSNIAFFIIFEWNEIYNWFLKQILSNYIMHYMGGGGGGGLTNFPYKLLWTIMDILWTVGITQPQSIVLGKHFAVTIIKLLNLISRIPIIRILTIYFCTKSSWNVRATICP